MRIIGWIVIGISIGVFLSMIIINPLIGMLPGGHITVGEVHEGMLEARLNNPDENNMQLLAGVLLSHAEKSDSERAANEPMVELGENNPVIGKPVRLVQNWSWEVVLSDGTPCVIVKMAHVTCNWKSR